MYSNTCTLSISVRAHTELCIPVSKGGRQAGRQGGREAGREAKKHCEHKECPEVAVRGRLARRLHHGGEEGAIGVGHHVDAGLEGARTERFDLWRG